MQEFSSICILKACCAVSVQDATNIESYTRAVFAGRYAHLTTKHCIVIKLIRSSCIHAFSTVFDNETQGVVALEVVLAQVSS